MKKIIVLLVAFLLIFTACTTTPKEAAPESRQQPAQEEESQELKEATQEPTAEPTEAPTPEPTDTPEPLPMTVAVVVSRDSYASGEFNPVMEALRASGYETVVVSDELGTADGFDETAEVQKVFTELSADELRGIVLIGGSDSLWENAELHTLLLDCQKNERVTAAICLASVTLAKAGVIGEGDEACWFNCDIADPEMEAAGVGDTGQPVTADGLIITGDGPSSAEEFADEIVAALDGM